MRVYFFLLFLLFQQFLHSQFAAPINQMYSWSNASNQRWIGESFWPNSLQEWEVKNGKVYCSRPSRMSTLHYLPFENFENSLSGSFLVGRNDTAAIDSFGKAGIIIGLSNNKLNYNSRSMIHLYSLEEDGYWIGIEYDHVFIEELSSHEKAVSNSLDTSLLNKYNRAGLTLDYNMVQQGDSLVLVVFVDNIVAAEMYVSRNILEGSICFAASSKQRNSEYFFNDLLLPLADLSERNFGPISTCLYSFNADVLNFSAQLAPLAKEKNYELLLEVRRNGFWQKLRRLPVDTFAMQARFRNIKWNREGSTPYRVSLWNNKEMIGTYYEGHITKQSKKNEVKIMAMSCNGIPFISNSNTDYKTFWTPYEMIHEKVKLENPDLLVFLGDQMYESRPVMMETDSTLFIADYYYRWLLWCREFNDVTRNLPCLIILDDHDYRQGNLWGDGAKKASVIPDSLPPQYKTHEDDWQTDNGGFLMNEAFLNLAEILQTGHLPNAYDLSSRSYFTTLNFNGIGIALLEDRKFKTSPITALPNISILNGIALNDTLSFEKLNNSHSTLLGNTQLKMLDQWSENWNGEIMKIAFTQSVYAALSSTKKGFVPYDSTNISINDSVAYPTHLSKDMDCNGWPKSGRDTALLMIRKSSALLVGGDQHFPSITQQGIKDWRDASYSFTIPAVNNTYPRFFLPDSSDSFGNNNYIDGFGNKVSMDIFNNPAKIDSVPTWLQYTPGFGMLICNKKDQTYEMKYMLFKDTARYSTSIITKPNDNAFSSSSFKTDTISAKGLGKLPLISIFNEQEIKLYSLRANNICLKVPSAGRYKITISSPNRKKSKIIWVDVK